MCDLITNTQNPTHSLKKKEVIVKKKKQRKKTTIHNLFFLPTFEFNGNESLHALTNLYHCAINQVEL